MVSWESRGGSCTSDPGVASWAPGRLDVVVRGTDNACWHQWYDGAWSDWESLGGVCTSEASAVSWGEGRVDVFVRGTDNACWHRWYEGAWSDWESLGGGFSSGISAASWAPGRLDLFGQGLDGACWHRWYEGGWSDGWENLGGTFTSGIASVSWDAGRIDLVGRGTDNACWHKWYEGSWSDWESLGGGFSSGLAAAAWAPGRLDLFGQGLDGACWHRWFQNGWSDGWESLGGTLTSGPAAVSWDAGRVDVFGRGTDDACWHTFFDNGGWAQEPVARPELVAVGQSIQVPVYEVLNLATVELPTFDQAATAQLQSGATGPVAALDRSPWRTFGGWLQPAPDGASAVVLCRKAGLVVQLSAAATEGATLLPFADGSPSLTLTWATGGAAAVQHAEPMEATVDVAGGKLTAFLPLPNPSAYGAMVAALRDPGSGIALQIQHGHHFLTQVPGPPVPDPEPDPDPGPRFPPRGPVVVRDHRGPRIDPEDDPRRDRIDAKLHPRGLLDLASPALASNLTMVRPEVLASVRLASRDYGRVILRPRPRPGAPTTVLSTTTGALSVPVYRPATDLGVYPDEPRPDLKTWDQVAGRTSDQPVLMFRGTDRLDAFETLPTRFKLGFFTDDDDQLPPISVVERRDGDAYRVSVLLTALPFTADEDRAALLAYLRDVVLQGTQPYVSLEPKHGLAARFVSAWRTTTGEVLPGSITFSAEDVSPGRRLVLKFDMDTLDYGIFCELLAKGIRGSVVLSEEGLQATIDVSLRLDDLVTNGVQVETEGFGTPADGAAPPDRSVRLRNRVAHPVSVATVVVACLDSGTHPGLVLEAESLSLLAAPQTLAASDDPAASAAFPVQPQHLAVWSSTAVALGTITVDGGSPQEWLDRVTRDPSLQPQSFALSVTPLAAADPPVKIVRLRVFAHGDPTVRQQQDIAPTGSTDLAVELRLTEVLAAHGAPPAYELEYECEYVSGDLSLTQRVPVSPTSREVPLSILAETPTSLFTVEHGLPGAERTRTERLDRSAAADVIGQARTRGELWQVTATRP